MLTERKRVSDLFTQSEAPFIVMGNVVHKEGQGKTLIVNKKKHIVWVEQTIKQNSPYLFHILDGKYSAICGKTLRTTSALSKSTTGQIVPAMIFFIETSETAFRMKRFNPTGGVIIPISTASVETTPNHMG